MFKNKNSTETRNYKKGETYTEPTVLLKHLKI